MSLNWIAHQLTESLCLDAGRFGILPMDNGTDAPVVDCGVSAQGNLSAGLRVAEICLAGHARVDMVRYPFPGACEVGIQVRTDQPVAACLGSQYAGWRFEHGDYFAMGSGPMRALAKREPIFTSLAIEEHADVAVGILESDRLPPTDLCRQIAEACDVDSRRLTLLVARTSSLVGSIQIVARSVETALHKLHELKFDIHRVVAAFGVAPMPPVGGSDLLAMGRTNDAILYGSSVTLWVQGDDDSWDAIVPQLPSRASSDYGRRFLELFAEYDHDFYRFDPLLFSPAHVIVHNIETGRTFEAGGVDADILTRSFQARS